jgi:hypothetical protein
VRFDEPGEFIEEARMLKEVVTTNVFRCVAYQYKPSPKGRPQPPSLNVLRCGKPDAFFSPTDGSLTVCLEFVAATNRVAELWIASLPGTERR